MQWCRLRFFVWSIGKFLSIDEACSPTQKHVLHRWRLRHWSLWNEWSDTSSSKTWLHASTMHLNGSACSTTLTEKKNYLCSPDLVIMSNSIRFNSVDYSAAKLVKETISKTSSLIEKPQPSSTVWSVWMVCQIRLPSFGLANKKHRLFNLHRW